MKDKNPFDSGSVIQRRLDSKFMNFPRLPGTIHPSGSFQASLFSQGSKRRATERSVASDGIISVVFIGPVAERQKYHEEVFYEETFHE
ncbi:MAG TPA: hypothetical protein VEI96_04920 [Thermodesulfovibrionales bacterium]|nr:hypothetical protein [Thermodesulfovibrionales bacterium]